MNENQIEELGIQNSLHHLIKQRKSFRFDAGAGSGKTHALKECLRNLLKENYRQFYRYNQQVLCVTYTNVAAKEIRERLGESELIIISTIHDLLWDLIKIRQEELLNFHKCKLENELEIINYELESGEVDAFNFYTNLEDLERLDLSERIKRSRELYYKSASLKSKEFREAYAISEEFRDVELSKFNRWFKNYSNFKRLSGRIYKRERYANCLRNINNKLEGYTSVEYDSDSNTDRLDKMSFSHDTLLEYSNLIFSNYPMMCRIVIDKYPYLFVDEYQDTSEHVINVIKSILDYSVKNDKNWFVGYFGDIAQTIYGNGVGAKIATLHDDICVINKRFNRRSHSQVIDIINRVRDDHITQEPIFNNRNLGDVKFACLCPNNTDSDHIEIAKRFLNSYRDDLINKGEGDNRAKINCLVLTNNLMTKLSGFGDVYDAFSKAGQIYFDSVNTKLLSNDLVKLHPTVRLVYRLVRNYINITSKGATYYDLFGSRGKGLHLRDADKTLKDIKDINPKTLVDLVVGLSQLYEVRNKTPAIVAYVSHCFSTRVRDISKFGSLEDYMRANIRGLMSSSRLSDEELTEEHSDQELELVNSVLELSIENLAKWVAHIDGHNDGDFVFHTYHGTKGEEYENIAIIIGHDFGLLNRNKIKNFFLYRGSSLEDKTVMLEDAGFSEKYENTKNLIYVACSRAIKNLRVLYLDDIGEITEGIDSIFGTHSIFPESD